jgi:hypothetical protein
LTARRRLATRVFALSLAATGAVVTLRGTQAAAATPALDGVPHIMQTVSSEPQVRAAAAASGTVPLTYQTANGPVEAPPVVYLVFWGEQWQVGWTDVSNSGTTYSSNQAMQYITGFFNYISGSSTSWFSSQTQYCSGVAVGTVNCGSSGTHVVNPPTFGGTWIDTTDAPPPPVVPDNCAVAVCLNPTGTAIDQANLIAQEALNAENHFGYSPNANYMIMLPKATGSPGYGYYCAYHGEAIDGSGRKISFTNMPYDLDLNTLCGENFVNSSDNSFGNGYMDGYSIVAGHEFAEAATDAQPSTNTAWLDSNGQETGDKCAWITPGTSGGAHNIGPDANGHVYAVQTLWSNTANGCV